MADRPTDSELETPPDDPARDYLPGYKGVVVTQLLTGIPGSGKTSVIGHWAMPVDSAFTYFEVRSKPAISSAVAIYTGSALDSDDISKYLNHFVHIPTGYNASKSWGAISDIQKYLIFNPRWIRDSMQGEVDGVLPRLQRFFSTDDPLGGNRIGDSGSADGSDNRGGRRSLMEFVRDLYPWVDSEARTKISDRLSEHLQEIDGPRTVDREHLRQVASDIALLTGEPVSP
jgi:hypothetical protein